MSSPCAAPTPWETLVDYWADELDTAAIDAIDAHLMSCAQCTAASARVAAVREAVRAAIPPFLSRAQVEALRARGLRIVENPVRAAACPSAVFAAGVDILLHRLGGLDLRRVERARVVVRMEETGELLLDEHQVPFECATGEILVACQRHFGEDSRTIVFEVHAQDPSGAEQVARYAIPHVFEPV